LFVSTQKSKGQSKGDFEHSCRISEIYETTEAFFITVLWAFTENMAGRLRKRSEILATVYRNYSPPLQNWFIDKTYRLSDVFAMNKSNKSN